MIQSPHIVKAAQVRETRQNLDATDCVSRSPFIVATSEEVTLRRLEDFSEEINGAKLSLSSVFGVDVPPVTDREKSVSALVDGYVKTTETLAIEGRLNAAYLQTVGRVTQSLQDLEVNILQTKTVPTEQVKTALFQLNALDLFVEASQEIYRQIMTAPVEEARLAL